MSWFDTSGFSSFAKTALSQAQKSIDRVLDIEQDETNSAASKSSASSAPKSSPSLSSGMSSKDNLTHKKSSSALSGHSASKSARKTSSDVDNSKDGESDGNSFWSSFLGDSFSSAATESKTSNRRASGQKLGSRISGGKMKNSVDRQDSEDAKILKDEDNLPRALKHQSKKNSVTDTSTRSSEQSQAPQTSLPVREDLANVGWDISEPDKSSAMAVDFQEAKELTESPGKEELNTHKSPVMPALRGSKLKSQQSKRSSTNKSRKENKEVLSTENNVCKNNIENVEQDALIEHDKTPDDKSESVNEHLSTEAVQSIPLQNNTDSPDANENELDCSEKTDGFTISVETGEKAPDVDSSDISQSLLKNSTGNNVVEEIKHEEVVQNLQESVKPVASSTPKHYAKEQKFTSLGTAMKPEMEPTDEHEEASNDEGDLQAYSCNPESPIPQSKESNTLSENVVEFFAEAASVVQDKRLLEDKSQQEVQEHTCIHPETGKVVDMLSSKQPRTNDDEKWQEKMYVMGDDPNSTESTEDTKRKIEELQNEICSLKHVIEVRENKLVEVSKENIDLQETCAVLRSQLKQAEDAFREEDEEIEEVRKEFTVRVAATEKKFQAVAKERDQLRALLEETENSLSSKNEQQSEEFTTLLKEKDDQISQLLEEGEKLSKQQLQSNNIVKKLRSKEKENDALIKKNSKLLEEMTAENTRLTEILKVKEETERKQADAITQLNSYVEKQDTQVSKLKSELDDSAEKIRSMQAALDNAYKQLADLHKENASKDSAVQEAALSAEMTAKEGLRIAMEKKERQFKSETEALEFQISDLQTGLRRAEQQASRREDNLRQEISDLQQRLQEAEARNQELTESVTYATRPLLRQIENLQSSYGNHTQTWERVERNLTERLNEAQVQLAEAQEKERVATEHALELNSRLTAVESQLATYRQDKSRLEATLEMERTRLETAEEARSRETAKIEALEIKYRKMMEDNNLEKALLEQQLAVEKGKMETEKKKFQHAMEEKERNLLRQSSISGAPPSPTARDDSSQDENPVSSPHRPFGRQGSTSSVIDGISRGIMGAGTAMVERLQAQVKQKDGEILLLQEEITTLQKTRDAVTEELATLTSKMESLEEDSRLLADLQTRYKELEQRHNAVLQMYGEKAEQAEELKMDLEDVKSMYKQQIQELLGAAR